MNRALLLGLVVAAGCGGNKKTFDSLCDNQVPPPEACTVACDPSTAAGDLSCPDGYFCAADGKCDAQCSPGGDECGANNTCTSNGKCVEGPGGGGDPAPDADCPAVHFTATKVTPSIQLLIDRSGSMLQDFGQPNYSKYMAVNDALVGSQGVVSTLQSAVYFGATLYSDDGSKPCPTLKVASTGRTLNNKTAIAQVIQSNTPLRNARTPTPPSIDAVVKDFKDHPAPQGSPPIIVLATDGLPNKCGEDTDTTAESVTAAKASYAAGIKLYILSVGTIANAEAHLQAMANAGAGVQAGQPNAPVFIGNNPTELATAFNAIIGGVVSCDLKLNGKVSDASNGIVTLNGANLAYGSDWTIGPDGTTLTLLGNACNTLKASADPKVDATFSCGAVIY